MTADAPDKSHDAGLQTTEFMMIIVQYTQKTHGNTPRSARVCALASDSNRSVLELTNIDRLALGAQSDNIFPTWTCVNRKEVTRHGGARA